MRVNNTQDYMPCRIKTNNSVKVFKYVFIQN